MVAHYIEIDSMTRRIYFDNKLIYDRGKILDKDKYEIARRIWYGQIGELKDFIKEGEVYYVKVINPSGFVNLYKIFKKRGEVLVSGIGKK